MASPSDFLLRPISERVGRVARDIVDADSAARDILEDEFADDYRQQLSRLDNPSLREVFTEAARERAIGFGLDATGYGAIVNGGRHAHAGYSDHAEMGNRLLEAAAEEVPYYDYDNSNFNEFTSDIADHITQVRSLDEPGHTIPGLTRISVPIDGESYTVIVDATTIRGPLDLSDVDLNDPEAVLAAFGDQMPHVTILDENGNPATGAFLEAFENASDDVKSDIRGNLDVAYTNTMDGLMDAGILTFENGVLTFDQEAFERAVMEPTTQYNPEFEIGRRAARRELEYETGRELTPEEVPVLEPEHREPPASTAAAPGAPGVS